MITEVASTGDASDSILAASDVTTTTDQTTPQPVTTPPAVAVPVTTPFAATLSATAAPTATAATDSATASTGAAEVLPAQAAATTHVTPADTGFNPTVAADTAAAMVTIIQPATVPSDTQQATQTTATQTGAALAAAVAAATPVAAKATVKTLDNAPSGRPTASVTTGIQPGPEASVLTTPSAEGGNPISSPDAALADHKHDAAGSAKNAPSDTGTFSMEPASVAPHPARAPDAPSAPQPVQADSGQSINSALAQPQVQSAAATTPATPQYNVAVVTGAAVPLNGLAVQIAVTALSGKSRFEIRLDPADLGRIDVRLDVDRQGRVTSHLTVEKPETLAMLRQDAPQLQRALQDAGLKTGDGGLQFSLRDQSSQEQNARDDTGGRHNQRLMVTEEDIPVAAAGRNYGRVFESNRGLDIRV